MMSRREPIVDAEAAVEAEEAQADLTTEWFWWDYDVLAPEERVPPGKLLRRKRSSKKVKKKESSKKGQAEALVEEKQEVGEALEEVAVTVETPPRAPLPPLPREADPLRLPVPLRVVAAEMPLTTPFKKQEFQRRILRENWNVGQYGLIMLYHAVRCRDAYAVGVLTRAGAKENKISVDLHRGLSAVALAEELGEVQIVNTINANGRGGRDFHRRYAHLWLTPDADDPGRVPEIGFVLGAPYKLARRVGSALGLNASASTAASRRTVRRAIFERLERLMPLVHQAGRIDIFRVHLREFALAGDDPDDALEVLSDSLRRSFGATALGDDGDVGFDLNFGGDDGSTLLRVAVAKGDALAASLILQTARIFRLPNGADVPAADGTTAEDLARRLNRKHIVKLLKAARRADGLLFRRTPDYQRRVEAYRTCTMPEALRDDMVHFLSVDLNADFVDARKVVADGFDDPGVFGHMRQQVGSQAATASARRAFRRGSSRLSLFPLQWRSSRTSPGKPETSASVRFASSPLASEASPLPSARSLGTETSAPTSARSVSFS